LNRQDAKIAKEERREEGRKFFIHKIILKNYEFI